MPSYTQEGRPIQISTTLGPDVLLLVRFSGSEAISTPFDFHLDLLSTNPSVDLKSLLGQPALITVETAGSSPRYIHGLFRRIVQLEQDVEGFTAYRAELVPWLWMLSLFSNCRIFQNKSVKEIVEQVFQDRDFSDYKFQLTGSYPKWEYCVQYRETDLNFISRLLEEEGIFYFFEHTKEKHTLVLADAPSAFQPCPDQATAHYGAGHAGWEVEDFIFSLTREEQVHTGKVTLTDYDFKKPSADLLATLSGAQKGEDYDYPGKYLTKDEGDRYARIRLEEREVSYFTVRGESNCRAFLPGYRFTLEDHYRSDTNQAYTLVSVSHQAGDNQYRSQAEEAFQYLNEFEAIPHSVPYRPPRRAIKPVVEGPQTAAVVGKSGEEIWVDLYGRVKVQFHWDRESKADDTSSCWIRVAQGWAGKKWGWITLPRVGQEVVVDFLEGDPDRPLITGSVYNDDQMPPYTLPDEQTKSIWKSYSSKGGGGFNEIRFEDKKGSEQIFIHAEKDKHIRIKENRYEITGAASHLIVGGDQLESVKGDKHLKVTGDKNEKVDGTISRQAGMDVQEKAGMNYAMDAGMAIHLKAGINLVIESGTSLTVKVGGNFINLNPAGVFIQGTMVMINSGGAAGSGAGSSPQTPKDPTEADTAEPGQQTQPPPARPPVTPSTYSPAALSLQQAAHSGAAFCDI